MIINKIRNQTEEILAKYSSELIDLPSILIDDKFVHKSNSSNVLISEVTENKLIGIHNDYEDINLYTCMGIPNLACNFIFDHPQDHYPLMLLIEMGRQMAISVSHLYKNIPFESCKNTVDYMEFKVHDFVELDYPLTIGIIDKITKNKSTIQIRELQYLFYQNGRLCCESQSAVSIMTTPLYNRYRLSSRRNTTGKRGSIDILTNEMLLKRQLENNEQVS
jgi:hypothetical protein